MDDFSGSRVRPVVSIFKSQTVIYVANCLKDIHWEKLHYLMLEPSEVLVFPKGCLLSLLRTTLYVRC